MTFRSSLEVWLIDLERDAKAFARMAARDGVLSSADRRRLQAFSQPADALAFAASRAGLRQLLEQLGGAPGTHLHRTRSGKPFAPGHNAVSVSHTRSHVAIAVSRGGDVGVDVEMIGRRVPDHALISRISALLGRGWPQNHRPVAAWTVVEAWTKLRGLTLAEMLDSPGRARELEEAMEAKASDLRLTHLDLPASLMGACWYEGPPVSFAVRHLEPREEYEDAHSYPNALA